MGQLVAPDTFEFFARYLLAGYVIIIVRSRFVIAQRPKTSDVIVEAVIFSLINQLIYSILDANLPGEGPHNSLGQLFFYVEIVVLPTILGTVLGLNLSRGWNKAFLRRLAMPVSEPVHRAHDFAFWANRQSSFIIITFEDGTQLNGLFGERSFASSSPEDGDIYLESLYKIDQSAQWQELQPARGAWISLKSAKSIEFLPPSYGGN